MPRAQASLFDQERDESGLTCALGEPWTGPHLLCAAKLERDCAGFDAAVARGEYAQSGHSAKELKAMARRKLVA